MDCALKQISNKFIIQSNTADFRHEIIKYTYHGASSYLIDKFLIIGYDNLLFDKEITTTKPTITKPASQMKLPSLYSKSSQAYPFTLQFEPNILSEICSDYDKTLLDNNIAFNYGKIGNLLKLQNNTYYKEILDTILKTGTIEGKLMTKFNLEEDYTKNDFISLLYYIYGKISSIFYRTSLL